ncbi:hypothetical protein M422DRAFT_60526 [Sphaerobolus stellatus SS14]|uniref:PNPLA domain-containing protein n=1 Tax=Sphaerobolus stellatus (strain SS14) TaxID=990650 RepID=A0A0C9UCU2_SPHS4|nr:hypothetical protein M422DRAFT_60526 [Sphaerobolus stellatus SS14]
MHGSGRHLVYIWLFDSINFNISFKSGPVDRTFCYRAVQLQLYTDSCHQGYVDDYKQGCWSWFEVVILKDANATEPLVRDGKVYSWRSHENRLDSKLDVARHFGVIFDRRAEILDALEPGNCIGVMLCTRFPGWVNDAGEDIFSPMSWTLNTADTPDDIPEAIKDGMYTLTLTTDCYVKSADSNLVSKIWFTTPILDEYTISHIQDIRLFTFAHRQAHASLDSKGTWSWFDLCILESSEATTPKMNQGVRSLVWLSHEISPDATGPGYDINQEGIHFTGQHELISLLKSRDVIGVRVCARFKDWELSTRNGRLVVRISNQGTRRDPRPPKEDWRAVYRANKELQELHRKYMQAFGREWRENGGGVRGVSSLRILDAVMNEVGRQAGTPAPKPCDYFDMIAGTSTGGLVAIMLGRLRMTIAQCMEAYDTLSRSIFDASMLQKAGNANSSGARYSPKGLEDAIKAIVKTYGSAKDGEEIMRDTQDGCKVFVVSCNAKDLSNAPPIHFRTFTNAKVEKSFADYKIWEAARATTAAPTYFPSINLGGHEYVDGGLRCNNPVMNLLTEAALMYGGAGPYACVLTIGTGVASNVALPSSGNNVLTNLWGAAKSGFSLFELSLKTGELQNYFAGPMVGEKAYFRFNVAGEKIAEHFETERSGLFLMNKKEVLYPDNWKDINIDLADWKGMGDFAGKTSDWLKTQQSRIESCASVLRKPTKA